MSSCGLYWCRVPRQFSGAAGGEPAAAAVCVAGPVQSVQCGAAAPAVSASTLASTGLQRGDTNLGDGLRQVRPVSCDGDHTFYTVH